MGKKDKDTTRLTATAAVVDGPIQHRSCTDVLCLLLFIVTWIGMVAVAIVAFTKGNPQKLLAPVDSQGNLCGYTAGYKDRPNLLFFDLTRCISSISSKVFTNGVVCNTPQVCVKACPNANAEGVTGPPNQAKLLYCRNGKTLAEQANGTVTRTQLITNNTCAPYYLKSESILGRCVPALLDFSSLGDGEIRDSQNHTLTDNGGTTLTGNTIVSAVRVVARLLNLRHIANKIWSDFEKVWVELIIGFTGTIGACFVFIALASVVLGPLIYTSMIGSLGLLGYGAYASHTMYQSLKNGMITRPVTANSFLDEYRYQENTFLILTIICGTLCGILFFICLFLLDRIRFAIAVIKEATKAMFAIKSSFLFPIIPALLQSLLFAYFVGIGVYLITSGTTSYTVEIFANNRNVTSAMVDVGGKNMTIRSGQTCVPNAGVFSSLQNVSNAINCGFSSYDPDKVLLGMQIFHLIGWIWTANWISALGQCVLAGGFASYYWLHNSKKLPTFPILASFKRTLIYHTGSLAFGAAIITIVQLIRIALVYLESKLKDYGDNKAAKYLLKCLQCIFACLERFLKFINKNAYIEIAIYGYNFCKAARTAFKLLLRNVLRTAALNSITSFILFMGKVLITGGVAVVSYLVFDKINMTRDLHYYLGPVILLTLAAYFMASSFFDTYDMAVDTIFLCVLEDLEHHDGTPEKPYHMSSGMRSAFKVKDKPSASTATE